MPIVQVFYISRCDSALTPTDVHRIIGSSQLRNRRRSVTGLLAYTGRHFAQVVEGSAGEVDRLLGSITGDPRHQQMKLLHRLEGVPRRFGSWAMHLVDSVARADEIEALFEAPDTAAAMRLLDALSVDARWQRADDMVPQSPLGIPAP